MTFCPAETPSVAVGRHPRRGEGGFTLVEVQVTIIIVGLIMSAFAGSSVLIVSGAAHAERSAAVDAEARRAAERLRAASYDACASGGYSPGPAANPEVDVAVTSVEVARRTHYGAGVSPEYVQIIRDGAWVAPADSPCGGGTPVDTCLQRITVRAQAATAERAVTIVKRADHAGCGI